MSCRGRTEVASAVTRILWGFRRVRDKRADPTEELVLNNYERLQMEDALGNLWKENCSLPANVKTVGDVITYFSTPDPGPQL